MHKEKLQIFDITDKNIVIIGATGLLGSRYVDFLSSLGAKVIIGDVDLKKCEEFSMKLGFKGRKTIPFKIDITDEQSIIAFFSNIKEKLGGIDVLINNAQVKPKGFYDSFENYSKKTIMKVLEGNTVGMVLSCQKACKIFLKQGFGNIINVASIYGITGADQRLYNGVENIYNSEQNFSSPISYGISKAGVVNMTKYLASYYREKNIRVNCLTPGGVFDNHDNNFCTNYSSRTLLGRMANKDEYNGALLYLASDASSYMTGANIIVDGGWTAI